MGNHKAVNSLKNYYLKYSIMRNYVPLSFIFHLALIVIFALLMFHSKDAIAITNGHDFTIFSLTGKDSNNASAAQLRALLEERHYMITKAHSAMKNDVIILGDAHSGIVNSDGIIEHYAQKKGNSDNEMGRDADQKVDMDYVTLEQNHYTDITVDVMKKRRKEEWYGLPVEIWRIAPKDEVSIQVPLTNRPILHNENVPSLTIPVVCKGNRKDQVVVEIYINKKEGDAIPIDDFKLETNALTWDPGQDWPQDIKVTFVDNDISEGNKYFTLALKIYKGYAKISDKDKEIKVSILDDDRAGNIRFASTNYSVSEDGKEIEVYLKRQGLSLGPVSVTLETRDGSATANKDFKPVSKTVDWSIGNEKSLPVKIPIIDDQDVEGNEDFEVILKNPTNGAKIIGPTSEKITIIDNDRPAEKAQKAVFEASEYRVVEGAGFVKICVRRVGGSEGRFSVDYSTGDAYATSGLDYQAKKGNFTWGKKDVRPKYFWVPILDDQEPEREETIHLQLSNPQNLDGYPVTIDEMCESVIYIQDNDEGVVPPPRRNPNPVCENIIITPERAVARSSAQDTITFRAVAVFNDGTRLDITNDPQVVWRPGPGNTYTPPPNQLFIENVKIEATWQGCRGSTQLMSLSSPISDPSQVDAKTELPPPDAYRWFALCNKKTGEVTYSDEPDYSIHSIMGGPFYGPVPAEWWINKNCPTWRCDSNGVCATKPADAPITVKGWYVLCEITTGEVTLGKDPDPRRHHVMAGPYLGEPDARSWVNSNCPNWRCNKDGQCAVTPAKGGKWNVLCNKIDLRIVLGTSFDMTRHILIEKDFLGEPDARAWVEQHYPTWSCTRDGQPVSEPRRGGLWRIYCNTTLGQIVASAETNADLIKLAGDFYSLDDAEQYMSQYYPSGLCDGMGRYKSGWSDANPYTIEDILESTSDDSGWSTWVPEEENETPKKDDFAAPGSAEAKTAIKETDEEVRPIGEKFAREWNEFTGELEQKQTRQQQEANEFLKTGIIETAKAVENIAASNIKRNAGPAPEPAAPSLNYEPVGPNWNPVDGWGKPGQIPTSTITCPANNLEREKKCTQVKEYIAKYKVYYEGSKIWAANLDRAYSYLNRCCGGGGLSSGYESEENEYGSEYGADSLGVGINLLGNEVIQDGTDGEPLTIRYPGEDGYWWYEVHTSSGNVIRKRTNQKVKPK